MGNLIVTVGEGKPHLLLVAHMDETGYAITHIRDDGFLEVRKLGGFYDSLYLGQHVQIHTEGGPVPGVVALPSTHLQASRTLPISEFGEDDVLIDVGTESRRQTEQLGILLLDAITIPKAAYYLAGSRMTARSMDDRFGCAALLALAERIRPGDWQGTLTLAWVVQEEVATPITHYTTTPHQYHTHTSSPHQKGLPKRIGGVQPAAERWHESICSTFGGTDRVYGLSFQTNKS